MRIPPLAALLLALATSSCASTPKAPTTKATAPGPLFCWALEKEGAATSYLLGSIHALPANRADIDRALADAYARSDELVVEVDTVAIDQDALTQLALERGMYAPDEPGLDERLPPALWRRTAAALGEGGMPEFGAKRQRPWLAALMVTTMAVQKAGFAPEMGVDHRFLKRAHEEKKPIAELETMEEQLELFAGLTEPAQIAMLQDAVAEHDDIEASLTGLLDAWAAGDAAALQADVEAPVRADPSQAPFFESWLYGRNARMATRIAGMLQDGRPRFVVVGAAHLVGPRGLLQLMRDRGYAVRQLSSAGAAADPASLAPPPRSSPPPPDPEAPLTL